MKTIAVLAALIALAAPAAAQSRAGASAVQLSPMGAGVRYFFTDRLGVAVKGEFDRDVRLFGLRETWHFKTLRKSIQPFFGLEQSAVLFNDGRARAGGYAAGLFAGGEWFISRSFSLQADLGPALVGLRDSESGVTESGVGLAFNFGINWTWGRRGAR